MSGMFFGTQCSTTVTSSSPLSHLWSLLPLLEILLQLKLLHLLATTSMPTSTTNVVVVIAVVVRMYHFV